MFHALRRRHTRQILPILLALASVISATGNAVAATLTVSTTADSGPGSLRQAIGAAQPGDTIQFSVTGTIQLTSGELFIDKNLVIDGPGASLLAVSGGTSRAFEIAANARVVIRNLTVSHSYDLLEGGGIYTQGTLTVSNCVIFDNWSGLGGGIINYGVLTVESCLLERNGSSDDRGGDGGGILNYGTLDVRKSIFRENGIVDPMLASPPWGGGIYSAGPTSVSDTIFEANLGATGGGIYQAGGLLTVTGSTFTGNIALLQGGGLRIGLRVNATVTNSTFSGNRAAFGGGIYAPYARTLVSHSTFVGNSAGGGALPRGDAIYSINDGVPSLSIKNSVFADGGTGNNLHLWPGDEVAGANFSTDASGSSLGVVGVTRDELNLGPLADNGGPTPTHALLAGSVAIDAATECTDWNGEVVATDQRGTARPLGTACDAGAFEFRPAYRFSGFLPPIDEQPTVNVVKAGSAVPVKFSLNGNQGLDIFAAGFPASGQVACDTSAPVSEVEQTVSAGSSGLTYDAASDQYVLTWKTDKAWKGTCRQLTLKFNDGGGTYTASFRFK